MKMGGQALLASLALACSVAQAGYVVSTSRPDVNIFEKNESAQLMIRQQKNVGAEQVPSLAVYDYLGNKISDIAVTLSGESGSAALPSGRLGYFEVRASGPEAEKAIPAEGSRPAGMLPFAVVNKVDPDPSRQFHNAFVALQGTTIFSGKETDAINRAGWRLYPYLGIQSVGVSYGWSRLAPNSPDEIDKNLAQDVMPAAIEASHMRPYFHLSGIPAWALDTQRLPERERSSKATTRLPPKDYAQFEAYLRKVIPYIAAKYPDLPERVYEITWEPCIPWGWYGTPQELAKLYEVSARVIHELDPKGRVGGPTMANLSDLAQLEEYLAAGVGSSLDVMVVHPYCSYPPERANIPGTTMRIRELCQKYAGRELPLYGTEFGLQTQTAGSPLNRAYATVAGLMIFKGEGFANHAMFYLADYAGEPNYGLMYNLVPSLPFGPSRVAPKADIPMARAAADLIGHGTVVSKLDYLGADIWGYVFRTDGRLTAAIWDCSGDNRTILFDAGTDQTEVLDCFGNVTDIKPVGGQMKLQLSRAPIYLRGLAESIYGQKAEPLLKTDRVWEVYRGQNVNQTLLLTRDLPADKATFTFDTASDLWTGQVRQTIAGRSNTSIPLSFTISPSAPLGTAVGYLRLRNESKTIYRALQRISVLPELKLGALKPVRDGNRWQVAQEITNVAPVTWKGTYHFSAPGEEAFTRTLELAGGASTTLRIPLTGPHDALTPMDVASECVNDAGAKLGARGSLSLLLVSKVDSAKSASFWQDLPRSPLPITDKTIYRPHPELPYGGAADLSGDVALAYDRDNLYVQVRVTDDVHRNIASPDLLWEQDSLQIAIDANLDRERTSNLLADQIKRTDCELLAAFSSRGPEVYLVRAPGGSKLKINALLDSKIVALEGGREGSQTIYRLRIPWTVLDPAGTRDKNALGIALAVNDSDKEMKFSDRKALLMFGGIVSGKDPAQYGRAVLQP